MHNRCHRKHVIRAADNTPVCIDGTIIPTMKHNDGDRIGNQIIYEEEAPEETKQGDQTTSLLDEQPKSGGCLNDKRSLAESHIHRIRERSSLRTVLPIAHPPFSVLTSPGFPRCVSRCARRRQIREGLAGIRALRICGAPRRNGTPPNGARAVVETRRWIRQIRYFVFRPESPSKRVFPA